MIWTGERPYARVVWILGLDRRAGCRLLRMDAAGKAARSAAPVLLRCLAWAAFLGAVGVVLYFAYLFFTGFAV